MLGALAEFEDSDDLDESDREFHSALAARLIRSTLDSNSSSDERMD